ncbi:hypothetical protein D3C72_591110 [compost metagenome]
MVASDPDRNPLQMNWAATDGTLSTNTGQVVSWIPPEKPGVYSVTVTVANGRGGFVTGTQNLTVQENGSAVIGGKPSSPPVAVSPMPPPSVVSSVVPSVAITPPASALPSTTPQTSPSPAPSPIASTKPYVQLDFTSQEARFGVASPNRINDQSDFMRLKVASASNAKYYAMLTEVSPTPTGLLHKVDFEADGTGQSRVTYQGVYLLCFVRADRALADVSIGSDKVRLKDGAIGTVALPYQATSMERANIQIPDGAWAWRTLSGCVFAFKYDGGQLHLGTFNLP